MVKKKTEEQTEEQNVDFIVEYIPVKDIQLAKYNPKKHNPKQFKRLSLSLNEFGWLLPITVNKKTGNIVDGNQRVKNVIKKYGANHKVPVRYIDVSEEKEKRINIALNATVTPTSEELFNSLIFEVESDPLIDELRKDAERAQREMLGQTLEPEFKIVQDADEMYDYIMLIFSKGIDFINVCDFFGIENVYDMNRNRKVGLGRAITGDSIFKLIDFARKNGINSIKDVD